MRAVALYAGSNWIWPKHHSDAAARAGPRRKRICSSPSSRAGARSSASKWASTGIQVHGGMGFIEETGAAQWLRDVRITAIYEGTTGIQANDLLGRKIGRDRGAAMKYLIADMSRELQALRAPRRRAGRDP